MKSIANLLATLRQHDIVDDATCERLANAAPGAAWLSALQAFAAWVAALLLASAFGLVGGMMFGQFLVFAFVLVSAAMAIFIAYRESHFLGHLALGLSVAGQVLLAMSWEHQDGDKMFFINAALALALTVPRTSQLHRTVCLVMAMGFAYARFFPSAFGLVGLALTALAVALWLARRDWAVHPHADAIVALAHAASFGGLAVLLVFHATLFTDSWGFWRYGLLRHEMNYYDTYVLGAALVWLATVGWLIRGPGQREQAWLAVAAVVIAALGYVAPAMLLCLALMLATFHACQRAWLVKSVMGALFFLGIFYYSLHVTLLTKSAMLAGAGAVFLALRWLIVHTLKETS